MPRKKFKIGITNNQSCSEIIEHRYDKNQGLHRKNYNKNQGCIEKIIIKIKVVQKKIENSYDKNKVVKKKKIKQSFDKNQGWEQNNN